MKTLKTCQLLTGALLVALWCLPQVAQASMPPPEDLDYFTEYTPGSTSAIWETSRDVNSYGDPQWQANNRDLLVNNLAIATNRKKVWLTVTYTSIPDPVPSITLTAPVPDGGVTPAHTNPISSAGNNLTWLWIITPQPANETIEFPNLDYFGLANGVEKLQIGVVCNPIPEPATLVLLALGAVPMLLRHGR